MGGKDEKKGVRGKETQRQRKRMEGWDEGVRDVRWRETEKEEAREGKKQ